MADGIRTRYVPNGRYLYAKVGSKRGAERTFRILPEVSDLDGEGWKVLDEKRWRTGRMGNVSDWGVRARQAGSVTAWRSFEQTGASRWMWTEAIPLASEADSSAAVSDMQGRFIRNPRAQVHVVGGKVVTDLAVPGTVASWAYEQNVTGKVGEGACFYLAGATNSFVFVVSASGIADTWTWDQVKSVANIIVSRIVDL